MKIIVTGGGTGGHIYPALAFIDFLKKKEPDTQILYIGGKRGLENTLVPRSDIAFETIELQGLKRKFSVDNVKTAYLFAKSLNVAKKMIRDFQPDVVLGTGGYVSGSVMYAASKRGIPTIVHEQNSVPGVTNKFLSRYVTVVATCFKEAQGHFPKAKRVELVGNPRAEEMLSLSPNDRLAEFGFTSDKKTVVLFGGSQGARQLNETFLQMLPHLKERAYQVLYASGAHYYEECQEIFEKANRAMPNVSIQPYIHEMPEVLRNADLVVTRAGATTIAEITAIGLPSILIPSPYVTGDHQRKNARALQKEQACRVIENDACTAKVLLAEMDALLLHQEVLRLMSEASEKLGIKDANGRLYSLIKEITKNDK